MNFPPLIFSGEIADEREVPTIGYAVKNQTPLGLTVGSKRQNWRLGILECFKAHDAGVNCFCAHCCCSIWTWESAVRLVPFVDGEDRVLQQQLVQDAIRAARDGAQRANYGRGSVLGDVVVAGYVQQTRPRAALGPSRLFLLL